MTLLELLIAMSIMVLVVAAMAGLSRAVQQTTQYCEGQGTAVQHGRVSTERICRTVNEATANASFPGFLVLADQQDGWRFPDTLVVWHPDGPPADPDGLPRYDELVIYCPDPAAPNQLLEITAPGDGRVVPGANDTTSWTAEIDSVKNSPNSNKVVLTGLLRTALVSQSSTSQRGAVRFISRLRPSDVEWSRYEANHVDWEDLPWVQGIYGLHTGLRQNWLRLELQLTPDAAAGQAIPLFGSAAVYYEMKRD